MAAIIPEEESKNLFRVGERVNWALGPVTIVRKIDDENYEVAYLEVGLKARASIKSLFENRTTDPTASVFVRRPPDTLVVDNFLEKVDAIRQIAEDQEYVDDIRNYKGLRTQTRMLYPHLKEEFERLLGVRITNWLNQPMNGVYQKTTDADPLVFHADKQTYAAAIYLTPDIGPEHGTSFWRHKDTGLSRIDGASPEMIQSSLTEESINSRDFWVLDTKVGSLYGRLAIWRGSLIHSASAYYAGERLVQLFFFDAEW